MTPSYECAQTLLAQADFDGELDAAAAAELIGHIERCEQCQAARRTLARTHELMRGAARYAPSQRLRDSIRAQARIPQPLPPSSNAARWPMVLGWGLAAALALLTTTLLFSARTSDLSAQLVADHVRALQLESHLIDVASSDHHTVKPWFAGKVSFSPPVKQLESEGYPLKGGRLDVIEGQPAAVLVYQAGPHIIDVYIWPAERDDTGPRESQQQNGFNLMSWQEEGFAISCVSDLNAGELRKFAERWQAAG